MIKVLVRSASLREIRSRKSGQLWFAQHAALDNGDDFAKPFDVLHDDAKKAYPPGEYTFANDAIYVSRDGKLSVSPRLVPLGKPAVPPVPKS